MKSKNMIQRMHQRKENAVYTLNFGSHVGNKYRANRTRKKGKLLKAPDPKNESLWAYENGTPKRVTFELYPLHD
jgi:hypothetical protein